MRNPTYVNEIAEIANHELLFPSQRSPSDLASGDAGLALMYSYLDACVADQDFDGMTQQYLRIAAQGTRQSTLAFPSSFGGTAGLAFTLVQASQGGRRYQHTLTRVHQGLCEQILTHPWRQPESAGGVASADFDLIMGAAGVLAYLVSLDQANSTIQAAIAHLLAYLLWLGEAGQPLGQERWYISPDLLPTDMHRAAFSPWVFRLRTGPWHSGVLWPRSPSPGWQAIIIPACERQLPRWPTGSLHTALSRSGERLAE